MKQRILTGVIFGVVVLTLLFAHTYSRIIFLALVAGLATFEYLKISSASKLEIGLIILFSVLFIYLIEAGHLEAKALLMPCILINVLLLANMFGRQAYIKHGDSKVIICIFYLISPFIIAYYHEWPVFPVYLISAILLIWVSDSAAFFVGSRIGKRKLFPRISPGKTWEGFWAAGLITIIAGYILFSVTEKHDLQYWLLFSIIIWIIGTLGDLIASHVKRLHGVKDSGNLLPGHGGFYDRFDALIYLLPFLLLFNQLYNFI